MKTKIILWIMTLILLSSFAFAYTECTAGENCTIYGKYTENGIAKDIDQANIKIISSNETIILTDTMTDLEVGTFIYTNIYNNSDEYLIVIEYVNNSINLGSSSETLNVRDNMIELTLVILLLGITFISLYAYKNIKTDEVPEGRVPEKMIWYTLGLAGILYLGFLALNIGKSVGYMTAPSYMLYIIIIIIVMAIVYFYFIYLIEIWLRFRKRKEEKDE